MSLDRIESEVLVPFVRSSVRYQHLLDSGIPEDLRVFRSERKCIPPEIESRARGEGDSAIEECTRQVFDSAREHGMFDDWVETKTGPTGAVTEVTHGDSGAFSRSTAEADGATFVLTGRMPRQEQGSPEVCRVLAEAKAVADGKSWTADARQHDGDDGCLRCADLLSPIPVQVTRANPQERFARAARTGSDQGKVTTGEAAAEIWQAIEKKLAQLAGRETRTILALSVGMPGLHGLPHVVREFRRVYGLRLKQQATFPEVWLVGYTLETTYRVHP